MAFHVQIFIYRIEPNLVFSWTAALLIEGFLISLALQKTIASRILLIPLFLISVIAASASFIVQNEQLNEQLLDEFFTQKRVIEQLEKDLKATQKAYQFGERYVRRTLQRERALRDELRAIMQDKTGDITLVNSLIFFLIIFIVQSANVHTAMTLKSEKFQKQETEIPKTKDDGTEFGTRSGTRGTEFGTRGMETEVSTKTNDTVSDVSGLETNLETLKQKPGTEFGKGENLLDRDIIIAELKSMKSRMTYSEMSRMLGIPKTTLTRIISTQWQGISDEIFRKISEKL
jgi:hypothetical protein